MKEYTKNTLAIKISKSMDRLDALKATRDEAWARVFADITVSGRIELEAIALKLSNKADNLMVRISHMGEELSVLWGKG